MSMCVTCTSPKNDVVVCYVHKSYPLSRPERGEVPVSPELALLLVGVALGEAGALCELAKRPLARSNPHALASNLVTKFGIIHAYRVIILTRSAPHSRQIW
jgi:hypothetical protein